MNSQDKILNFVAVMQPYIFPNISYMSLVHASDTMVFYDDVNFVKRGWINRNQIIINRAVYKFTVPLKKSSQNLAINEIEIVDLKKFRDKFIMQLEMSYKNAPYKQETLTYIDEVLGYKGSLISELASNSIEKFFSFMNIEKRFLRSSKNFACSKGLEKTKRLISITKELKSKNYVNAIGGISLYKKDEFLNEDVSLKFLKSNFINYRHCNSDKSVFFEGLSIIDLMMNLSKDELNNYLNSYNLI